VLDGHVKVTLRLIRDAQAEMFEESTMEQACVLQSCKVSATVLSGPLYQGVIMNVELAHHPCSGLHQELNRVQHDHVSQIWLLVVHHIAKLVEKFEHRIELVLERDFGHAWHAALLTDSANTI
jgi:hypothetical protein